MMKAKKIVSIILPVILAFSYTCKPALAAGGKKLTLFYAANLTTVMNELTEEFKKTNPDTEIISESSGSVL
ncbi:MAG: hypothetical protein NT033_04465, partial [Candidatus Omnitrophica bacterium]|nr:hypothetical protein [Candidatus Omnitrophota bacterium]